MGNCQAVDNASLVIQHKNRRVERLYSPISAADVMKLNPGHHVVLLLTTTTFHHTSNGTTTQPLRITRIKLLRPNDSLALGHAYRLITTQEVIKGLKAKNNKKREGLCDFETAATRSDQSERVLNQVKKSHEPRRKTAAPATSSAVAGKPRGWHPSLKSISEAKA